MATFTTMGTQMKRVGSMVEQVSALYTDKTTTDNGEWLNMLGVRYANVVVNGITTGTVNLRAWNGSTAPAATEHGEELKAALTADGMWTLEQKEIPAFMKVYISVATTITLDVDLK